MKIEFFVAGNPIPQGSMKAFMPKGARFPVVTHNKTADLKSWRGVVAYSARDAMSRSGALMIVSGPVSVKIDFLLHRPRAHYGTGKNADKLKPNAPAYSVSKPDIDKLERAILDALTGVVWTDDSQVAHVEKWKHYSQETGAVIVIQTLDSNPI